MLPKNRPPTHPGEMLLKEFMEPLHLSQKTLAKHLAWPYGRLNEIINGRRAVTVDSALALGDAFGTGPEFWLNLQRDWDLWHQMREYQPVAPIVGPPAAASPVAETSPT
jgi:antitoxin HigA-1